MGATASSFTTVNSVPTSSGPGDSLSLSVTDAEQKAVAHVPAVHAVGCDGSSTLVNHGGTSSQDSSAYGPDSPSSKRTSIDNLPDEVLIKILAAVSSNAESPAEVVTPSLTCKKWNRLGKDKEVLRRTSKRGVALHARQWSNEAYLYLRKLCGVGCLEACFILGMILFYCIPGAQMEGGRLLVQTAKLGHAAALHASGIISFNGSGWGKDHKDLKLGVSLMARGSALGHVEAMRELGHCLLDGFGVEQNQIEGWRMMVRAHMAENGLLSMPHEHLSRKRKQSVYDSSCPSKKSCSQTQGSSSTVCKEVQQIALHNLLHRPVIMTQTPEIKVRRVVASDAWATSSISSRPPTPPGPASAGVVPFSRESAQKLLHASTSSIQKGDVDPVTVEGVKKMSVEGGAKIDPLKALEILMSSGRKLSAEAAMKIKALLSAFQTSSLEAVPHPAHTFIMEWYGLAGDGEAKAALQEGLGFCSRAVCGRPETRQLEFWRCSTCWSSRYCSRSCQLHDWRIRHCRECLGNAAQRQMESGMMEERSLE